MSIQKVNTEAIAAAAAAINSANARLNGEFDRVRAAGMSMDNAWNSRAGNAAQNLMYELFKGNDSRSAVLQNYADTLLKVVDPNYTQSESANSKLADLFL